MNQTLQLNLSQQLKLSPQLQQSVKLLQCSQLALQQEIEYQLQNNPLLSLYEDSPSDELQEQSKDSSTNSEPHDHSPFDSTTASSGKLHASHNGYSHYRQSDSDINAEASLQDSVGLREHLEWQIQMLPLSDLDLEIAYYVIENLDDAGFLTVAYDEIVEQMKSDLNQVVSRQEVLTLVHHIQQLEPFGCASENLQVFLLLQLQRLLEKEHSSSLQLASKLVRHHFNDLCKHQYDALQHKLQLTEDELSQALEVIRHLRSQPNHNYLGNSTQFVQPDMLVYKENDRWQVQLCAANRPQLLINHHYAESLRQSPKREDQNYLKQHLQSARCFIQNLEARNDTLRQVAEWIVNYQQNFFDAGESALKPMKLNDIAEDLGLHESTISRACSDKYLQSPRGIFELKYFFSNAIPSTQGGEWSSTAIKHKIKQYIKAEPSRKPLSDLKLTQLLQQDGISIARRTVAKYRESLKIPPAYQRKFVTSF